MFTGLVVGIGRVLSVQPEGETTSVVVSSELDPGPVGASVSVSGVCLTVVEKTAQGFRVVMAAETLAKTTLGSLVAGGRVNLELPLAAGDRLGGHFVQGHVDGVGKVGAMRTFGAATELCVNAAPELLRYVVAKGSIAIDGVSLTVNTVGPEGFSVLLIPHTLEVTALSDRKVGDRVNLEVDILGKYVERLLEAHVKVRFGEASAAAAGAGATIEATTLAFLQEHGFASR